jgi:hypothetical protein
MVNSVVHLQKLARPRSSRSFPITHLHLDMRSSDDCALTRQRQHRALQGDTQAWLEANAKKEERCDDRRHRSKIIFGSGRVACHALR